MRLDLINSAQVLPDPPVPRPGRLRAVPAMPRHRAPRPDLVERAPLVRRLVAACVPIVLLRAPAGYGKTTLLCEWARADPRPFVWLALSEAHDAPAPLQAALDETLGVLADPDVDVVLVLEDADVLADSEAVALLGRLPERLGAGSTVALAARAEPALPLGRLRAQGALLELGVGDLAMGAGDAAMLLRRAGLRITDPEVAHLVERTAGWPAGLHLAAIALRGEADVAASLRRFGGDDSHVADYLRDEVLADLGPGVVALLRDVSVLDPLTGPVCDAVLDRHGCGRILRRLARSDTLVVAIDRCEERFRLHPLLRDLLRADLRRDAPERERVLHHRAATWHEEQGEIEEAIDHAIAAAQADRAGALLWSALVARTAAGRLRGLRGWLRQFRDAQIAAEPTLALAAAVERFAAGDRDAAERWVHAAQRTLPAGEPAARSLRAGVAIARAAIARDGVAAMGADASEACRLDEPDGPWQPVGWFLRGVALHLTGEPAVEAEAALQHSMRLRSVGPVDVRPFALAQLALLAFQRSDVAGGALLADRARVALATSGLIDHPSTPLVHAVCGLAGALAGRADDARRDVVQAQWMLDQATDLVPWYDAEARIVLARALLRLSESADARRRLSEAARAARRTPDAVVLTAMLDDAWERADAFAAGAVSGQSALTIAELRVLRFLPSHLSFREIAGRLHVSTNTIKTQAHAVYRKLDASSRSEAVARARDVGLVDG